MSAVLAAGVAVAGCTGAGAASADLLAGDSEDEASPGFLTSSAAFHGTALGIGVDKDVKITAAAEHAALQQSVAGAQAAQQCVLSAEVSKQSTMQKTM